MSYSILYRPMFLKVKENMFIPIYEGGDNNVWNCDNKSRARSWCNTHFKGMENVYCGETELLDILSNIREEVSKRYEEYGKTDDLFKYSDKQFGFFDSVSLYGKNTVSTSWNDYLNFFKKGFRNAITFEEAVKLRIFVTLSYYDSKQKYHNEYIHSEEELFSMIDKIKTKAKEGFWVCYSSVSDRTYDFVNTLRSKRSYSTKVEGNWTIETAKGFIKAFEGMEPVFTRDKNEALILTSNKVASKLASTLLKEDNTWYECIKNEVNAY